MRSFMICTPHQILLGISNKEEWREEVHTRFWWGNLRERNHLEDPSIDGRIILRWIFRKWDGGALAGLVWHRTGTGGGHLRFHKCGEFLD
jgi:hypothetical protein